MAYLSLITDWLVGASSQIIYNVVIAFLLVVLGVALGFLAKGIIMSLLRGVKLDELVSKLHIGDVFGKLSVSEVFADLIEIAIIIAFTAQALAFLGWELIAEALSSVLAWIPGVAAALVIFLVFYAIGRAVQSRMEATGAEWNTKLAPVAMAAITFFGAVVALDQVGLDTSLVRQAVLILLFGLALAFALAVGIAAGFGLKDEASDLVRKVTGSKPKRKSRAKRSKR